MKSLLLFLFILAPKISQAYSLKTAWDELASPLTTEVRPYFLSGALVTGIFSFDGVEDSLGHKVEGEAVEDKPLGRFSKFGDLSGQMIPNAIYMGATYGLYYFGYGDLYKDRSVHMLKSTFYSAFVTTVLKYTIREPRPDSQGRDSFPSGHTTTAFAFAAVVGSEHEWYWGVSAYSLAALVAYSRINDNAHHLHDVIGGAVIGMSYGLSLHYLYKEKDPNNQSVSLLPYGNGFSLQYRQEF